jgi:hypothetical protein
VVGSEIVRGDVQSGNSAFIAGAMARPSAAKVPRSISASEGLLKTATPSGKPGAQFRAEWQPVGIATTEWRSYDSEGRALLIISAEALLHSGQEAHEPVAGV